MVSDACIIVMAKWPEPSSAKTRLAADVGIDAARRLACAFLADTLDLVTGVAGAAALVSYTPAHCRPQFEALCGDRALLTEQPDGHLGTRLVAAFEAAFGMGFRRVIVIATDSPSLPRRFLEQALGALHEHPLVIGPADDGGYYLLGLRQPRPRLFEEIAWSTAAVLEQTLARAAEIGIVPVLLPAWFDVDTAADLQLLRPSLSYELDTLCRRTLLVLDELEGERAGMSASMPAHSHGATGEAVNADVATTA